MKDRIRVSIEVFKKMLREQERLKRVASSAQAVSFIALAVSVAALILSVVR
jgi:hypothetical protein